MIEQSPDVRLASLNIDAGGKRATMIMDRFMADQGSKILVLHLDQHELHFLPT